MGLKSFSAFKQMAAESNRLYTLTGEDTKKVQQKLLDMMEDVGAYCSSHHLTYVMTGGCALGAVRHQGFIPWDDDIDICMPREDYDRFAAAFAGAFEEKYEVQEIRSCQNYDLNFMKIRLKGTVFCELLDPEPEKAGIFIDIFPIEHVYMSSWKRSLQHLYSDGLQFICSCVRVHSKKAKLLEFAEDKSVIRMIRLKSAIGALFSFQSLRSWLLLTERFVSRCKEKDSSLISIPVGRGHFKGELYPTDWFYPPKRMDFAGHSFAFPAKTHNYLKQMYGDYMTIPPEEKREHHSVLAFDLGEAE